MGHFTNVSKLRKDEFEEMAKNSSVSLLQKGINAVPIDDLEL